MTVSVGYSGIEEETNTGRSGLPYGGSGPVHGQVRGVSVVRI